MLHEFLFQNPGKYFLSVVFFFQTVRHHRLDEHLLGLILSYVSCCVLSDVALPVVLDVIYCQHFRAKGIHWILPRVTQCQVWVGGYFSVEDACQVIARQVIPWLAIYGTATKFSQIYSFYTCKLL